MAIALRIEKNFIRTERMFKNMSLSLLSIIIPEIIFSNKIPYFEDITKSIMIRYIIWVIAIAIFLFFIVKLVKNISKRLKSNTDDQKIELLLEKKNIIEDNFGTHEVEIINNFGNAVIGGNHLPDASIIKQRIKKSSNVIKTISILNGYSKELVGYYVLYPLSKDITKDIIAGEVLNAKQLQLKDITEKFNMANSLYIGMLLGNAIYSKAAIERILERDIKKYLLENPNIKYIFAKPASSDGHRIVSQNGFNSIENSEIKYIVIDS